MNVDVETGVVVVRSVEVRVHAGQLVTVEIVTPLDRRAAVCFSSMASSVSEHAEVVELYRPGERDAVPSRVILTPQAELEREALDNGLVELDSARNVVLLAGWPAELLGAGFVSGCWERPEHAAVDYLRSPG